MKESHGHVMWVKMCTSYITMCPLIVCHHMHGWMKVCASACCIDRSSTASLCTSQFQNGQYNNKKSLKKTPFPLRTPSADPAGVRRSRASDGIKRKCICSVWPVLNDFASIDRKAGRITFWNSAWRVLFDVTLAAGPTFSLFPSGKVNT